MILPAMPAAATVAALAALLAEVPPGERHGADARAAERLDHLEYEARWQGAAESTLAAIAGVRLLLGLGAPRRIPGAA